MRAALCLCLSLTLSLFAEDFPKPFNSGNDVGLKPMPAEDAVKLIKMPPGFRATVFAAEPDVQNPIACAWDSRGRLWVAENYTYADSKTNFDKTLRDRILIFEDTDNDGRADKRTIFAEGLQNLSSIELGYGGVYATAAPHLLFIPDRDGDDRPDAPVIESAKDAEAAKDGKPADVSAKGAKGAKNSETSTTTAKPQPFAPLAPLADKKTLLPGTSIEVLLDGFDAWSVRHNFVNGLRWGPDGWLYGRHGIQATSRVGTPGTPDAERVAINCCIWRFHPVRRAFEIVTWGGTNPWGLDFNAEGEGFFTNTVTGHLYHVIPGAHYERMYGEDPNPHIYQLLPQTADHYHYDRSKSWTDSRDGKASDLGGGHAHSGCMIYLGENWPAEYRGKLFTLNFHGRRINVNSLERKGSGYVGKSEPDMIFFGDPWFRGIELTYGPDGGVYVLDWSDQGECHENDGVHRESGRIYKITHGEVKKPAWLGKSTSNASGDLAALTDEQLVRLTFDGSEWESRIARRLLAERAKSTVGAAGGISRLLREQFANSGKNPAQTIRLLCAIQSASGVSGSDTDRVWANPNEHVRAVAARFYFENKNSDEVAHEKPSETNWFSRIVDEQSWLVRAAIIGHLPRNSDQTTIKLVHAAVTERFGDGPFYQIKEGSDEQFSTLLSQVLAGRSLSVRKRVLWEARHPGLAPLLARSVASELVHDGGEFNRFLELWSDEMLTGHLVFRGVATALRGSRGIVRPANWDAIVARTNGTEAEKYIKDLSVVFGDMLALDEVQSLALDNSAELATRRQAIQTLINYRHKNLRAVCEKLVTNGDLAPGAIRGLATFDDPAAAALAVANWPRVRTEARAGVIGALCSRPVFARALLDAIGTGKIARENLTAYHARQLATLGDAEVSKRLAAVWGEVRTTPDDKKRRIAELKAALTPEAIAKTDITKGRAAYTQACAACHTLFDLGQTGANLGPNLTGSGRGDINYLLENIVDPSAIVPADYKLSTVTLKDGRVLSGFISAQNEQTLTLRTMTETQTVPRADVAKTESTPQSLMPDGLLDTLTPEQVRDLFGFLMKK